MDIKIISVVYDKEGDSLLGGPRTITVSIDGQELKASFKYRKKARQSDPNKTYYCPVMVFENKLITKHPEYKTVRRRIIRAARCWVLRERELQILRAKRDNVEIHEDPRN